MSDAAPVHEGEVLAGKYRVEKVLGVGGMGVVVAARHIQLDERVALKFLLPQALGNPEAVARNVGKRVLHHACDRGAVWTASRFAHAHVEAGNLGQTLGHCIASCSTPATTTHAANAYACATLSGSNQGSTSQILEIQQRLSTTGTSAGQVKCPSVCSTAVTWAARQISIA